MIKGIDISKWQGEMDWAKAAENAHFAFIRAGSINNETGDCYTDYQFDRNAEVAPDYLPVAYYWYFRPKWNPHKQADYFMNLVFGKDGFGVVGDFEETGTTHATASINMKIFMDEIGGFGKRLIYTRGIWWNSVVGNDSWPKSYALWIARYNNTLQHPWGDGSCKPHCWDDWLFWQFTSSGPGSYWGAESEEIDLNYFNGEEEDFLEYIGNEVLPPPIYQVNVPSNVKNFTIEVNRT